MIKKFATLGVVAVLATAAALYSAPSQAQSPSYYFVGICGVPNVMQCPIGPAPNWYGPYPSFAACVSAHDHIAANSIFGQWPYTLSTCFPQ